MVLGVLIDAHLNHNNINGIGKPCVHQRDDSEPKITLKSTFTILPEHFAGFAFLPNERGSLSNSCRSMRTGSGTRRAYWLVNGFWSCLQNT